MALPKSFLLSKNGRNVIFRQYPLVFSPYTHPSTFSMSKSWQICHFFHLAVLSVHPTVIQAFIPASFAFTWPATDYFSAKVTGCVQSANPVPPKVPAGNLPLRTKRISAVRFAFMSFGPLIGQKNNPVAGRENGYIREIKEIQSSTIKNKNVWKLKTFRP